MPHDVGRSGWSGVALKQLGAWWAGGVDWDDTTNVGFGVVYLENRNR